MNPGQITLEGSLLIAIPLSLLAGVITFISPCVLPLVPGYLGYVSGSAAPKSKVLAGSALFVLGFTAVFVQLGVSTRGLGSVVQKEDTSFVGDDFMLMAVDVVSDPSGIDCWVNAVNESADWVVTDDGKIVEQVQKEFKKKKLTEERALALFEQFLRSIK